MENLEQIGKPSSLTCPGCNGALWEIYREGPLRYRCHTGHAFTAIVLGVLQGASFEDTMWAAVRALHEQERLFTKMHERAMESRADELAAEYLAKAEQARAHSQSLRYIITTRVLVVRGK